MARTEQAARQSRATEKIRDDIDPANTWVVSDNHFGHNNIVGFCHRPEDHEQVMIAEWRKEVPDDATVLHLGDLAYRNNGFFKNIVAKELTGARKLLIKGNHDKQRFSFYRDCGFKLTRPFSIAYDGPIHNKPCGGCDRVTVDWCDECGAEGVIPCPERWLVSFSHYPWDDAEEGRKMSYNGIPGYRDLRLHGHIHNNGYSRDAFVPFLRNHINLSLEQTKYRPVNLKLLLDAALLGDYPETTQEQLDEARARKAERGQKKS